MLRIIKDGEWINKPKDHKLTKVEVELLKPETLYEIERDNDTGGLSKQ